VLDLQSAKTILGSCIHLLVQKIFLCIGITYLSSFPLGLLKSTLSFNCTLAFRLGHNLLNILKFMISKQKFSLIFLLPKHKAYLVRILPLFFTSTYFLSTKLHNSSRVLGTSKSYLCTKILFSLLQFPAIIVSGPRNGTICWHRDRPRFQCLTMHQQNHDYRPFRQHLRSIQGIM
jgi:hypothetical protein